MRLFVLHLRYSSRPLDKNALKQRSLHVVTLKLHSAITTRKSQLFIVEAEITSVTHPHFLERLWVTTLAAMACCSLVWAHGVFLSPALDTALCSSET